MVPNKKDKQVGNEIRSAAVQRPMAPGRRVPSKNTAVQTKASAEKKILPPAATSSVDDSKRGFLKLAGVVGLGVAAASVLPRHAEAYVMGGTPTSSVVGVKDSSNARINPATEEGQGVTKLTATLSSSGTVHTPASGKKIRVYATRFSLTANLTSVSFRFTSGGTDHEIYLAPVTGGLYGSNNHPNYVEGGADQVLYCVISGTGSVQINVDYLEV